MRKKNTSTRTKLLNWSKAVRERDGNRCFVCGSDYHCQAHHICQKKMWSKLKFDINNGITLCVRCHSFGKFSVHRGTDLLLIEKLLNERPQQYRYLLEAIHEEFEQKKKEDEQRDEPLDELDWPENQVDDDGSDDWCKNGW